MRSTTKNTGAIQKIHELVRETEKSVKNLTEIGKDKKREEASWAFPHVFFLYPVIHSSYGKWPVRHPPHQEDP